VRGADSTGTEFARVVIVCTGTFLNGCCIRPMPGRRAGDMAATG
jgi:hypothetical protein